MVDNRSAGFFGVGGAFNFKSGDISGTAANTQDDKMGQGTEYSAPLENEDEQNNKNEEPYVDRSAQLRATLNSLAMMNVATVINAKKRHGILNDDEDLELKYKLKKDEELELEEDDEEEYM